MKKFLLTVVTLFCLTTAIYGDDNDRQQSNRTNNMRSSSTRSTVNNNGSPRASQSGIRFYWAKIYSGGTLVRDFIPVRKNGVGYLYDKVSGTLFGNAGSGSFTYGNDVNT